MNITHLVKNAHVVSIGLFVISLPQTCFICGDASDNSFIVLLVGWMGVPIGGANLVWLANPLLAISWILFSRHHYSKAALTAGIATITAFSFLFFHMLAIDEGGSLNHINSVQLGYWFWLSSCFIIFIGSAFCCLRGIKGK